MPVPSVSFDSIRSAIPAKAHPMARAAGLEATAVAAKVHAPGSTARRTRAISATAKETEHLASAATTVAQRLETLAADREPAVDRARRSKKAAGKAAVPAKKRPAPKSYNYRGDDNASGRGTGDGPKKVREGSRAMKEAAR